MKQFSKTELACRWWTAKQDRHPLDQWVTLQWCKTDKKQKALCIREYQKFLNKSTCIGMCHFSDFPYGYCGDLSYKDLLSVIGNLVTLKAESDIKIKKMQRCIDSIEAVLT